MVKPFNFNIESTLSFSMLCKANGLNNFLLLCNYLKNVPYGRTADRSKYLSVLTENKGTCSTKHAFLKQVAIENKQDTVQFFIGIYKMNEANTKGVGNVLKQYNLEYIPEAHTYLKVNGAILDITRTLVSKESFNNKLLLETEIQPKGIGDYKIQIHQNYLKQWLLDEKITYTLDAIWNIRELCIYALSK